jgi:glutamate/tyrosine decarboxylase-like PLP-dependent enzyme
VEHCSGQQAQLEQLQRQQEVQLSSSSSSLTLKASAAIRQRRAQHHQRVCIYSSWATQYSWHQAVDAWRVETRLQEKQVLQVPTFRHAHVLHAA